MECIEQSYVGEVALKRPDGAGAVWVRSLIRGFFGETWETQKGKLGLVEGWMPV